MGIHLNEPIKFGLEEIEFDDHLPAIKLNAMAEITQFSHVLKYNGEIWVDCHVWDSFVNDLFSLKKTAILHDMSNIFCVKITISEQDIEFFYRIKREGVTEDTINFSYVTKISKDIFSQIRDCFKNYPKWW